MIRLRANPRRIESERGETLLELLVALMLLATSAVAIVGGFAASISWSDIHRKQAKAGEAVRNYAEVFEHAIASGAYLSCGTVDAYAASVSYSPSGGYTASIVPGSMRYWNGTGWTESCVADLGLQRLTLEVVPDADNRVGERITIVVRKPCGPANTLCGTTP